MCHFRHMRGKGLVRQTPENQHNGKPRIRNRLGGCGSVSVQTLTPGFDNRACRGYTSSQSMKTSLRILAVVIVLAAVGTFFLLRNFGPSDPAELAPDEAIIFAQFPDGIRSVTRWQGTSLAQILNEAEVKAFLEKPMQKLGGMGGNETGGHFVGVKPIRFFMTAMADGKGSIGGYGGFQFFGDRASLDKSMDSLRTLWGGGEFRGSEIEGSKVMRTEKGGQAWLYAVHGRWCFVAADESSLRVALVRAAGKATTPSLAKSGDFRKAIGPLPKEADVLLFARVGPLLDFVLKAGESMGAQPIQAQVNQLRGIETIAAASKIDGRNLRDGVFVRPTQPPAHGQTLEHQSIRFAGPETLIYLSTVIDWQSLQSGAGGSPLPAGMFQNLATLGLTPDQLPQALGGEFDLSVAWAADSIRPDVRVIIPVRDPELTKRWIETLSAGAFPQMMATDDPLGTVYTFGDAQPMLAPTMILTRDFLLFGLSDADIRAVASKQPGVASLENSPAFAPAKATFERKNEVFGFVDAAALFRRTYEQLRPVISFSAALMPGVADVVDVSKLPEAATITKHLQPITYSIRRTDGGILMESEGPITLNQSGAILAAATVWFQGTQQ